MKFISLVLFAILTIGVQAQPPKHSVIKFTELNTFLSNKTDTLYVINFWASWCKPCMDELPFFLKAEKELSKRKIKFIFVSLDFKNSFGSRFLPAVQKHTIQNAYLLNEPDYNSWINKVDPAWEGSIPATLMVKSNNKYFAERQFTYEELMEVIIKNLN